MRPLITTNNVQQSLEGEQPFFARSLQVLEGVRKMEWRDRSGDEPLKVLESVLNTVRKPTWNKYLKILLMAADSNGVTMNQISDELKEKPQSIHPLLKRMIERGALIREKNGIEFCYRLHPRITLEAVKRKLDAIADEGTTVLTLDDVKTNENSNLEDSESIQVEQMNADTKDDLDKGDRASTPNIENQSIERKDDLGSLPKLPNLPEFDPNWSEERKDLWFVLYGKLLEERRRSDD